MRIALLFCLALLSCSQTLAQEGQMDLQRIKAEKNGRALKLQGVIEEVGTGDIRPVAGLGSKEDATRYASFCANLNGLRKSYFAVHPSVTKSSYVQRIKDDDEAELNLKTGKMLLRIGSPPSLSQRLLPELIKGYLGAEHSCTTFGTMVWDKKNRWFGKDTANKFVCVSLEVSKSEVLYRSLNDGQLDVVVGYSSMPAQADDGVVIGLDGLAIIANPQSKLSSTGLKALRELCAKTWLTVENELDCRISSWAPFEKTTSLNSFDAVEDLVFQDESCVAIVPLGFASFTDNKVLRVETTEFPHGYRPTQLTVSRGLYPWRRTIVLKQGKTSPEDLPSFVTYLKSAAAKQLIMRSGYASTEP